MSDEEFTKILTVNGDDAFSANNEAKLACYRERIFNTRVIAIGEARRARAREVEQEAEITRYREALERISGGHHHEEAYGRGHCARPIDNDVPCWVVEAARLALAPAHPETVEEQEARHDAARLKMKEEAYENAQWEEEHTLCLDCDALITLHRSGQAHCVCGGGWPCQKSV